MYVVLSGGVGAARLLTGITRAVPPDHVLAIANVGDDLNLFGLHISPDIDTILYTTAGQVSRERGWGLTGESWQAMEMLSSYQGTAWFNLGDRDLGTHLHRTQRLAEGATLATVTAELAKAWNLRFGLTPVTNDRLRTMVSTVDEGEISFQEYFVRRQHSVPVTSVRFEGADDAEPAPGVIDAIEQAERVIIAPSNPVVSIDPVLAVPGIRAAVERRRNDTIAVSPIIGGKALKGPADRLMVEMGHESSVVGIAKWYQSLASSLVIDTVDAEHASAIASLDVKPIVMPTVMSYPGVTDGLARAVCGEG